MYTYTCHFFFVGIHLFVLAPLSETFGGGGQNPTVRVTLPEVGRDPCSVSRVASLLNFFGLGHG